MWLLLLGWMSLGHAQSIDELQLAAPGQRSALDIEVYVAQDGNLYLGDDILFLTDIEDKLLQMQEDEPELRAVIVAEATASYETVMKVVQACRDSGVFVALEIQGAVAAKRVDAIFEGVGVTEVLDEGLTRSQEQFLKPKHHRLPQNPYGTTDFTAYTLEWGETRMGLVSLEYGLAPGLQLGSIPVLDAFGAFNMSAKVNISRGERAAFALGANYVTLPLAQSYADLGLAQSLGLFGETAGEVLETTNAYFFGISAYLSYRVADPVTAHLRLNYVQARAEGQFSLLSLPSLIAPGLNLGLGDPADGPQLVPALTGETASFHVGLDYRLNRRDSILFRFRGPMYAGVRIGFDLDTYFPEAEDNFIASGDLALQGAYQSWVSPSSFYAASLGWQFQWRQWESRIGVGISAPGLAWTLQAFDIGYRFGGKTRRDERALRKAFKSNMRDLDDLEVEELAPPPADDELPFPPPG